MVSKARRNMSLKSELVNYSSVHGSEDPQIGCGVA